MDKNSQPIDVSKETIKRLLKEDAFAFVDKIITERVYLKPENGAADFWRNFKSVVDNFDFSSHPIDYYQCAFLSRMQLFFGQNEQYQRDICLYQDTLLTLNPSVPELINVLALILEIGDIFDKPDITPDYSFKSLRSMKCILYFFETNRNIDLKPTGYSLELYNCVKQLLALKIDVETLMDFIGAYETHNFDLNKLPGNQGYELAPVEYVPKSSNNFILERLKTEIKLSYKRNEAQDNISGEQHFKDIDKQFKTHEGFAGFAVSGATIVSKPDDGITNLELDDKLMQDMSSSDPLVQQRAIAESLAAFLEQHFHYHLRQFIADIYFPNDILNIHHYDLKIAKKVKVNLYEVFCVTSCIAAMAYRYEYMSQFPDRAGIRGYIPVIIELLKQRENFTTDEELKKATIDALVNNFGILYSERVPFVLLKPADLLMHLKKVKELAHKKDKELLAVVDKITSFDGKLAYAPIYKSGEDYIFLYKVCTRLNFNKMVYDYFISQYLFKFPKRSHIINQFETNDKLREIEFCSTLAHCLSQIMDSVVSNLDYPKPNEKYYADFDGEFDHLSYLKRENAFLTIQVKLSNTVKVNENGKAKWIKDNILSKASVQIIKDHIFLTTKNGLDFAVDKLKLEYTPVQPKVFHLIITDNFYFDHEEIVLDDNSVIGICISFFELFSIINNTIIHKNQKEWENVIQKRSLVYLLELIYSNAFWSFLDEMAEKVKIKEELKLINVENRISMVI